jgi:hypothetical protein
MVRVWVVDLRRRGEDARPDRVPSTIRELVKDGADASDASRHFSEYAKSAAIGKDDALARRALVTACGFLPAKTVRKPFYAFVKEFAKAHGVEAKDLVEAVDELDWAPDEAKKAAKAGVK